MQDTKFAQDEHTLNAKKETQFIQEVTSEFIPKSLTTANFALVKKLNLLSFLPQIISFITAAFFIYYVLSSYSTWVVLALGVLLLVIALGIEYAKRELINGITQKYLIKKQINYFLTFALFVLFGASMTVSFIGGDKLVKETAHAPTIAENAKIDSLNVLLQKELILIDNLQNTTWRGKITRDANKGINASKQIQSSLLSQMSLLAEADNKKLKELELKHESKITSFGLVLGIVACLCDLVLLSLLVNIKRFKYDVLLLHNTSVSKQSINTLNGNKTAITQRVNGQTVERATMGFKQGTTQRVNATGDECTNCGSAYHKKVPHQKYCSSECRIEHWQQRNKKELSKYFY